MKKFFKVTGYILLIVLSVLPMMLIESATPFLGLVRFIECWGIFWMTYYLIKHK